MRTPSAVILSCVAAAVVAADPQALTGKVVAVADGGRRQSSPPTLVNGSIPSRLVRRDRLPSPTGVGWLPGVLPQDSWPIQHAPFAPRLIPVCVARWALCARSAQV